MQTAILPVHADLMKPGSTPARLARRPRPITTTMAPAPLLLAGAGGRSAVDGGAGAAASNQQVTIIYNCASSTGGRQTGFWGSAGDLSADTQLAVKVERTDTGAARCPLRPRPQLDRLLRHRPDRR